MLRRITWTALVLTLLSMGCSAGPEEAEEHFLTGRVLGVDGELSVGAPVGILYGLHDGGMGFWPPEEFGSIHIDREAESRFNITFRFALEHASTCSFYIHDYQGQLTRTLFEHGGLSAMEHEVVWESDFDDGSPVPNGLYRARLEVEGPGEPEIREFDPILLNSQSMAFGDEVGAIAFTDERGEFQIPLLNLPIGELVAIWDGPKEVPDSLWIQSQTEEGRVRGKIHLVDMEQDIEVELQLETFKP